MKFTIHKTSPYTWWWEATDLFGPLAKSAILYPSEAECLAAIARLRQGGLLAPIDRA